MRNKIFGRVPNSTDIWSGWSEKIAKVTNAAKEVVQKVDLNLLDGSARIALVGSSRSGKTVLLTSLLDHLRNHDPRRFRLDARRMSGKETAKILRYEVVDIRPDMTLFPFELFRRALQLEGRWPEKTKDTFQYRIKIHRDDSILSAVKAVQSSTTVTFLDFPGERMADALMTTASYAQWSDFQLGALPTEACFKNCVDAFNSVVAEQDPKEEVILLAYKAILVERLKRFHSSLSPSTFTLCPQGSIPEFTAPFNTLLSTRFVGLSESEQFCPLPIHIREKYRQLAVRWEQAYENYRQKLILPLYSALRDCDRLCLLVNIPELLQSGVGAYNDQIDLLRHILAYCTPSNNTYWEILRGLSKSLGKVFIDDKFRPGGIERVAFVATQADRVSARDMDLLHHLIKQIQLHSTRSLPGFQLPIECFTCAAVQCTQPLAGQHLVGRLFSKATHFATRPELVEFEVSKLPDEWPDDWEPSDYCFPEVCPLFNKNLNSPPVQSGLDRVFNYLIQ